MKYPQLITFDTAFQTLSEFATIIDVRSPSEFAEDHIPGAINCPVLNDQERILVGTTYKQVSAFEAKKIGAALVAKNIGTHLENLFLTQSKDWNPLIYCWRGGNRSGSMAHIFAKIGWPVTQLDGGYKSYRHFVNAAIPPLAGQVKWRVICGPTGTGKSQLLRTLKENAAQVLDLEDFANHRGSVLGKLPDQIQPSQKFFETKIWEAIRHFDFERPVYVEAESKKVGNLRVPDSIMESMRQAPCIQIELDINQRVKFLLNDYAHFVEQFDLLEAQLNCLKGLYGKAQIDTWLKLAQEKQTPQLVRELLDRHYDPAYQSAIERNFQQIKTAQKVILPDTTQQSFVNLSQMLIQTEST
jgi:tRNA 2-selenouridine synthase